MRIQLLTIALLGIATCADAKSPPSAWAQFRGPTGQGTSPELTPVDFGLDHGMRWQTPISGKGWSSPVIAGDRVWMTTATTTEATEAQKTERLANVQMGDMKEVAGIVRLYAVCLDLKTGKLIHNLLLTTVDAPQPIHPLNSYASPTPAIDGDRVYCHFGAYGTWCLNASTGEIVWTRKLVVDHSVGPGSSPIIEGDHVLLVYDGIDTQFVCALEKMSGEMAWKTPRPPMRATNGEFQKAYSTPLCITVAGVRQAVVPGAQWIVAYDPKNGKEIWRADHGNGFSISSTAAYTGDDKKVGLVVFTTGYGQSQIVAVRPDGKDDVTLSHIGWRVDKNVPEKPSPIAADGLIYFIDDSGVLSCLDAADATVKYRKRIPGNYSASPLLAGGNIYLSNQAGIVTIIKQGEEFEEIAEIELDGQLMASPAVVDGDLIFRSVNSVMRFTKR